MKRLPALRHRLAPAFGRAVDSLTVALSPGTNRHYRGTVRKFLTWLGAAHPEVRSADQLRRDPHVLGWMSCLRSQTPPLATVSCLNLLIRLRCIFDELAWTEQLPELTHLIRREDIPRRPRTSGMRLCTRADCGTGPAPATGISAPQRSGRECSSAASPHRYAHR